jgi:hypothetical protein
MLRLRVFISFASNAPGHRDLALSILSRLEHDGFSVFVDSESLRVSDAYDQLIREEIDGCDYFIFLISPQSINSRSYCRTELSLAKKRWRNPRGRIFPVMVSPLEPNAKLPQELEGVQYLSAVGNVPANAAAALVEWRKQHRRPTVMAAGVAMAMLLLGTAIVAAPKFKEEEVALQVEPVQMLLHRAGVGAEGDLFRVDLKLTNKSNRLILFDQVELEVNQPEIKPFPSFKLEDLPVPVRASTDKDWAFEVVFKQSSNLKPLQQDALPSMAWTVCWKVDGKRACSRAIEMATTELPDAGLAVPSPEPDAGIVEVPPTAEPLDAGPLNSGSLDSGPLDSGNSAECEKGFLQVNRITPHANIFLDGQKLKQTPLDMRSVCVGEHKVRLMNVECQGQDAVFTVTIKKGELELIANYNFPPCETSRQR